MSAHGTRANVIGGLRNLAKRRFREEQLLPHCYLGKVL